MLVRAAQYGILDLWHVKSIDSLPIKGLLLWKPSKNDNDYSVFKITDKSKTGDIVNVVIKLLSTSFNLYKDGIEFILLDESLFISKGMEIKEDQQEMKCTHANIKNLDYEQYKNIIEITYTLKDKIISFDSACIKKILVDMPQDEFNNMVEKWHNLKPRDSINEIVNQINKRFFKDCNKKVYSKS